MMVKMKKCPLPTDRSRRLMFLYLTTKGSSATAAGSTIWKNQPKLPLSRDTRKAIDELLAGKPVSVPTTKVFGCSIKWAEKSNWIDKAKDELGQRTRYAWIQSMSRE